MNEIQVRQLRWEVAGIACWAAMMVAAIAVVPESLAQVPSLVAGLVFLMIGALRWVKNRVFGRTLGFALAAYATTLLSVWAYTLPSRTLGYGIDVAGEVAMFCAVSTTFNAPWRVVIRSALPYAGVSTLLVWCFFAARQLGDGLLPASQVGLLAAYNVLSLVTLATAATFASRTREYPVLVFAVTHLFLSLGDLGYALADAGIWRVADRWLYVPYACAYATVLAIFLPAGSRRFARARRITDPWPLRQTVLAAAVVAIVATVLFAPVRSSSDRVVRLVLAVVVGWSLARAITALGRRSDRVAREQLATVVSAGPPTREAAVREWLAQARFGDVHEVTALVAHLDGLQELEALAGDEACDEAIEVAARRLGAILGTTSVGVQRAGTLVAFGSVPAASALAAAEKALVSLSEPLSLTSGTWRSKVSIGVASSPAIMAPAVAARTATRACLQVVAAGGGAVSHSGLLDDTVRGYSVAFMDQCHTAVTNGQVSVACDLIISTVGEAVEGVRCRVAWSVGTRGVHATELEAAIEDPTVRARMLADSLSHSVHAGAAALSRLGQAGRKVFLELSAAQVAFGGADRLLVEAATRSRVALSAVVVCITERELMTHEESLAVGIERLTDLGCGLAATNFGSSHLGLTRMRGLPLEWVFLADVVALRLHHASNRKFVRALALAGAELGWRVASSIPVVNTSGVAPHSFGLSAQSAGILAVH